MLNEEQAAGGELLPCPFCGCATIFVEPDERGSGGQHVAPYHVGCTHCKAEQCHDDEAEARYLWNCRAAASSGASDAPQPATPTDAEIRKVFADACDYADNLQQAFSWGRTQALRKVFEFGRKHALTQPAAGASDAGEHEPVAGCGSCRTVERLMVACPICGRTTPPAAEAPKVEAPGHALADRAVDYLKRTDMQGSPLRSTPPSNDQIERHTLLAKDCPPDSKVMLVNSIRRLRDRAALAQPSEAPKVEAREGLTDVEIRSLWQTIDNDDIEDDIMEFARAIEASTTKGKS